MANLVGEAVNVDNSDAPVVTGAPVANDKHPGAAYAPGPTLAAAEVRGSSYEGSESCSWWMEVILLE